MSTIALVMLIFNDIPSSEANNYLLMGIIFQILKKSKFY